MHSHTNQAGSKQAAAAAGDGLTEVYKPWASKSAAVRMSLSKSRLAVVPVPLPSLALPLCLVTIHRIQCLHDTLRRSERIHAS